jgi:hypothetical protein
MKTKEELLQEPVYTIEGIRYTRRYCLQFHEVPRGEWRVCIIKSTGQPFLGKIVRYSNWGKFLYVHIPQLNQEITSDTYNWEIL